MRVWGVVAGLVVAALVVSIGAAAGSVVKLKRLAPGDQVAIAGTMLRCSVSSAGGPTTIVCGQGGASGPRAGSFAFAAADDSLLVLKASKTATPVEIARRAEPVVQGAAYPGLVGGGRSLTATVGTALTVAGTHVFCAVTSLSGRPYVTCGPADGTGMFVRGGFVGVVSDTELLAVRKLSGDKTKTVLTRRQPALP